MAVEKIRWPVTGERLALFAAASAVAMLPLLRPSGPGNSSAVDGLIALTIGFTVFWAGSAGLKLRLPYALAMAVFVAAGALAALMGPFPVSSAPVARPGRLKRAVGLLALVQDFVVFAWCAALVNVLRSPRNMQAVLRTWAWAAAAWAALLVVAYRADLGFLTGVEEGLGSRASLTFGDANMAASFYFVGIMVVWAARTPRHPLLRAGAYGLLLWAMVLTGSNGGMVSLLVGVGVTSMVLLYRRLPMAAIAVLALCALVGLGVASQVHLADLRNWAQQSGQPLLQDSLGRSGESAEQRRLLLEEGVYLYFEGGVLGWGPNASQYALAERQAPYVHEMHDDYVAALVERGILGALALLLLIGSIGVRVWSVVSRPLSAAFAAAVPRTAPLLGAAVGLAVDGTFYQVLHFRHLWALLAIVAALHLWGREHLETPPAAGESRRGYR